MNDSNIIKKILVISQPVALILAFILLLIPYEGKIHRHMYILGNASNTDTTISITGINDIFFSRIDRLQNFNIDCSLEIFFVLFLILSIIISVLAIFIKLKIFDKIYFVAPYAIALILFLWVTISNDNSWLQIDNGISGYYCVVDDISYSMFSGGSVPVIMLLMIAIAAKAVKTLYLKDNLSYNYADDATILDNYGVTTDALDNNKKKERQNDDVPTDKFEEVRKYKTLLDNGIITQEEFDQKKNELFNIPDKK